MLFSELEALSEFLHFNFPGLLGSDQRRDRCNYDGYNY